MIGKVPPGEAQRRMMRDGRFASKLVGVDRALTPRVDVPVEVGVARARTRPRRRSRRAKNARESVARMDAPRGGKSRVDTPHASSSGDATARPDTPHARIPADDYYGMDGPLMATPHDSTPRPSASRLPSGGQTHAGKSCMRPPRTSNDRPSTANSRTVRFSDEHAGPSGSGSSNSGPSRSGSSSAGGPSVAGPSRRASSHAGPSTQRGNNTGVRGARF